MALPQNALSSTPLPAPFQAPRNVVRFTAFQGTVDTHMGGIALGDPSQGLSYQLWTAQIINGVVYLSAPNTAPFAFISPGSQYVWVALSFDQNARAFIAYADAIGNAFYYWFDTTIPGYRTTGLAFGTTRVFAALDDIRPVENTNNDIILAYVRASTLFYRQERDRFGVEYNLGAAPATLVQIGMNTKWRFQFAFQNVKGASGFLPPQEWQGMGP